MARIYACFPHFTWTTKTYNCKIDWSHRDIVHVAGWLVGWMAGHYHHQMKKLSAKICIYLLDLYPIFLSLLLPVWFDFLFIYLFYFDSTLLKVFYIHDDDDDENLGFLEFVVVVVSLHSFIHSFKSSINK